MFKKSVERSKEVLRQEGAIGFFDHIRIKLHLLIKARWTQVCLDGCIFNLEGVPEDSTKVELLINRYEVHERRAVLRYLPPHIPVIELGGSMGVVACITNRLLKTPAQHLVVEANPLVIAHLELSKDLNHCAFEIVNKAIAYGDDTITFRPAKDFAGTSVTQDGVHAAVTVQTTRLSELASQRGFTTFSLICDIEGQEYQMIFEEADIIRNAGLIIMETHPRLIGEQKVRLMMEKLHELGFKLIKKLGPVVVLER
jgi:FkbM family methyltransferase